MIKQLHYIHGVTRSVIEHSETQPLPQRDRPVKFCRMYKCDVENFMTSFLSFRNLLSLCFRNVYVLFDWVSEVRMRHVLSFMMFKFLMDGFYLI